MTIFRLSVATDNRLIGHLPLYLTSRILHPAFGLLIADGSRQHPDSDVQHFISEY